MTETRRSVALALGLGLVATTAFAQSADKVRIGLIQTLSGPAATLGQQARDGFNLAVKELGGKLGGRDAEVIVVDDELKPDVAVTKVKGLVERDKVDFVVGPIFSNVLLAIHKPALDGGAILISANAGPSSYAGKECHPNFFVTSYQNDQVHEVLGKVAQNRGYKKVYLLAPNYQAGRDSMAGFKRHFKGEVVEESYVPLNNARLPVRAREDRRLAAGRALHLHAGRHGREPRAPVPAGRPRERMPFLSAFTVDESTLPAQQDAAIGLLGGMTWAPNIDNPVEQGLRRGLREGVQLRAGLLRHAGLRHREADRLAPSRRPAATPPTRRRSRRRSARPTSSPLRGPFKFNANGYPIQDFYLVKVAKRPDGKFQTEIVEKVFENYGDVYAKDCKPAS